MSNPDPLLMLADIAQVESEHPHLDPDLVRALYQHLVMMGGRQPNTDEWREYAERVTSTVDETTLRQRLGLEDAPRRPLTESPPSVARAARVRGRPKGTRSATRDQLIETFRSVRTRQRRRPTQVQLAANLTPPIAVRTLQDLLAEYDLPWPIE